MLVPLFGIQLLLTIYRPDGAVQEAREYEYITIAVTNSQVISCLLVSLLKSYVVTLPIACTVV